MVECYWPVMRAYYQTGRGIAILCSVKCIALDGVWLSNEEVLKVYCWLPEWQLGYDWPDCVQHRKSLPIEPGFTAMGGGRRRQLPN